MAPSSPCSKATPEIPFPFKPYPVQQSLMQEVYRTLEEGKVGLFESPTGTGKSLSLICSTLTWLRDRVKRDEEENAAATAAPVPTASQARGEEPAWLRDYGVAQKQKEAERRQRLRLERQARLRQRIEQARDRPLQEAAAALLLRKDDEDDKAKKTKAQAAAKRRKAAEATAGKKGGGDGEEEEEEDEDLLPKDYASGAEGGGHSSSDEEDDDDEDGRRAREAEEMDEIDRAGKKILYVSRTHSQVSQFVVEINKTVFQHTARVVSLGSRKNLCINDDVTRLGSDARMSDRCLDMQRGRKEKDEQCGKQCGGSTAGADKPGVKRQRQAAASTPSSNKRCPFLHPGGSEEQEVFRDYALSRVQPIEELAQLGRRLGTCPYYGSRRAIAQADVIAMPYTLLLHKDSRESLKIPLAGNVVVVDEAHNLIEAINATYTATLSLQQLSRALSQTSLYWERYSARLSGQNAFYVQQILRVLRALVTYLTTSTSSSSPPAATTAPAPQHQQRPPEDSGGVVVSVNQFLFDADMDNVNLFKMLRYMERSQICRKVLGFAERRLAGQQVATHPVPRSQPPATSTQQQQAGQDNEEEEEEQEYVSSNVSSLQIVQRFLSSLTGADKDGRVVVHSRQKGGGRGGGVRAGLKFIMLNASKHFKQVVEEAHAVVLAGGTLQPFDQVLSQLLPELPAHRLRVFSCGHVIPPHNLIACPIAKGPTGLELDLTHKSRALPSTMDELGRLLLNVSNAVPGGVVVFLPSYRYEEVVMRRWQETGTLAKIDAKKQVFREPKRASEVDGVLSSYGQAIEARGGALLVCVVGAKMSEGINFSDQLARCVVMVGLPYPDRSDPELQHKLAFIDTLAITNNTSSSSSHKQADLGGGGAGRRYYQGLCMRAVNQSIGRAIRHANDFAAILLVDKRYQTDVSIPPLLPGWIQERLLPPSQAPDFGRAFAALHRFFKIKKEQQQQQHA